MRATLYMVLVLLPPIIFAGGCLACIFTGHSGWAGVLLLSAALFSPKTIEFQDGRPRCKTEAPKP